MEKILVVGATGNVGSLIVKELVEKGYKVKAAVRDYDKAKRVLGEEIELVKFSFEDSSTFKTALEDVSHVFLIAPPMSPNSDEVVGPFISAAKELGVKHITAMTAMGVDASDEIPYRKVELQIIAAGFSYSILRPNWFNQNFHTIYLDQIKNQGGIFLPVSDAKTSFIDVRDIAAVAVQTLIDPKHSTQEYTLTGSEAIDHTKAMKIISDEAGKEYNYTAISDEDFKNAMAEIGLPDNMTDFMLNIYGMVKAGYTEAVSNDVEKVLSRAPISFAQYAKDFADSWK